MATRRLAAFAACPDRQPDMTLALAVVDAARDGAELAEACERVRVVIGSCSAPAGTGCYAHKVARMMIYHWHGKAQPEKSRALAELLGRLPLWRSGAGCPVLPSSSGCRWPAACGSRC
jgi:hypothetical protein